MPDGLPSPQARGLLVVAFASRRVLKCDDRACVFLGRDRVRIEGQALGDLIEVADGLWPSHRASEPEEGRVRLVEWHRSLDATVTRAGDVVLLEIYASLGRSATSPALGHGLPAIGLPVLLADDEGRVVEATVEVSRLFGPPRELLLDDGWMALIHATDFVESRRDFARAIREGRPGRMEFRLAEDPRRWIEVRLAPSRLESGRPLWTFALTDITMQVRTESERSAVFARLRAVLEGLPDAAAIVEAVRDERGSIVDLRWSVANTRTEAMIGDALGYDVDGLAGRRLGEVLPATVAERELRALGPLIEAHEGAVFMEFAAGASGEPVRLTTTVTPVVDGLFLLRRAESDTEARERRLVASEERLRLALDGSRDGVWDWDLAGELVVLEVPDSATLQYPMIAGSRRLTREEAFRLVHPDDAAGFRERIRSHLRGETEVFEFVHRVLHNETDFHWRLTRGRVVSRDARGAPVRVVGTTIDVTQRRASEQELERAKELAEAANRTKSEFLANVSHELRTPLNTIIGLVEIVLDEPIPPQAKSHLRDALAAAESLLRIIRDLLDFSAMEAGRFALVERSFDLRVLIDGLVRSMSYDVGTRNVVLEATIEDDVPAHVMGDPVRLRQVLTNLVGNALKFTENGRVDVRIRRERPPGAETPGCLRVDVTDTGPGIAAEKLGRIFAPFEQADTSTTRRFGGTGLGLAIVRRLVELMGGRVDVLSHPGEGSTFSFTFEYEVSEEHAQNERLLRVLVVADDRRTRQRLEQGLSVENVRVTTARSEEILGSIRLSRSRGVRTWDIAVVDASIRLSSMEDTIDALRDVSDRRGRIVLLGDEPSREAFTGRVDCVLPHTVDMDRLLTEVRTLASPTPRMPTGLHERPLRILIAEDSPVNQHVIRQLLSKLGHESLAVEDGASAVRAVEDDVWDLILMDVQMPELDGFEATRQIREREHERGLDPLPIIALTADARDSTRELCLRAGMNAWLTKPVRRTDLAQAIRQVLLGVMERSANP